MNFSHLDITKRIKESILSMDASAEGHLLRKPLQDILKIFGLKY